MKTAAEWEAERAKAAAAFAQDPTSYDKYMAVDMATRMAAAARLRERTGK